MIQPAGDLVFIGALPIKGIVEKEQGCPICESVLRDFTDLVLRDGEVDIAQCHGNSGIGREEVGDEIPSIQSEVEFKNSVPISE